MRGSESRLCAVIIVIVMLFMRIRTSSQAACENGWFGNECEKQCHCEDSDQCNAEGGCSHKCQFTYYGPSCQVFDAMQAYGTGLNNEQLLDQDISTCVKSTTLIVVQWNMSIQFTTARLEFGPDTDVYDVTKDMTISFRSNASCGQMGRVFNGHIVDINCGQWKTVNTEGFNLTFRKKVDLCNLYVKIGVDVALKAEVESAEEAMKNDQVPSNTNNGDYSTGFHIFDAKCFVTKSTERGCKMVVYPRVKTRILFARVFLPNVNRHRMDRFVTKTFTDQWDTITRFDSSENSPPVVNNIVLLITADNTTPVYALEILSPLNGPLQVCGVIAYADLLHNEPCINREHCQPEYDCYDGRCQCLKGLAKFNEPTKECQYLKRPLECCSSDEECIINSTCIANTCHCKIDTHYHNKDADLCLERLPHGHRCKTNDYCVKKPHIFCINGRCICEGFYSYIQEDKQCVQLCPKDRFGPDCIYQCHCSDISQCLPSGLCAKFGCARGWFGPTCQIECPSDWYGDNCMYKCHCANNSQCSPTGECGEDGCAKGWFGPQCQYADLTTQYNDTDKPTWLYDGDDKTCNKNLRKNQVVVRLREPQPFTWLRIHTKFGGTLHQIETIMFKSSPSSEAVQCTNKTISTVDEKSMDVFCDLTFLLKQVLIAGDGVKYICSVHISGGRNIAFQHPPLVYPAPDILETYKAVDGNRDGVLSNGSCMTTGNHKHDNGTEIKAPKMSFDLPRPVIVNRIILYNRVDAEAELLQGFRVGTFDAHDKPLNFSYQDHSSTPQAVYKVMSALPQPGVKNIFLVSRHPVLTVCEVEIYGDSECPLGKFGRDCELNCSTCDYGNCLVHTGLCLESSVEIQMVELKHPCVLRDSCAEGSTCVFGKCSCIPETHTYDNATGGCVKKATLFATCTTDRECAHDLLCIEGVCKCPFTLEYNNITLRCETHAVEVPLFGTVEEKVTTASILLLILLYLVPRFIYIYRHGRARYIYTEICEQYRLKQKMEEEDVISESSTSSETEPQETVPDGSTWV